MAGILVVSLAWRSVAFPLGLAGVPALITSVAGSNPLPKGGTTLLIAGWIAASVAFLVMRGRAPYLSRALMTLPVAAAVVLLGLMLIRLSGSGAPAWGSSKIQLYVADNLMFLVGGIAVGADAAARRRLLLLVLGVSAAGALYLLFQLATGSAHEQLSGRFSLNAQEGPIYLGRSSAMGVLIAAFLILSENRRRPRLWGLALLPVLIVSLVAAGSRGPMVAFVVAFIVLLALSATTRRGRRRLAGLAIVLAGAAILVPALVPGSAIGRSLSTIIGSASGLSSNGRSSLWQAAYDAFNQHFATGLGTGGFSVIDPVEKYPHNILLEVAVELGVLGAVALLTMVGMMVKRMSTVWRAAVGRDQLEVGLFISLLVMALVNAFFSGAIQDNAEIWLWGGVGLGLQARFLPELGVATRPGGRGSARLRASGSRGQPHANGALARPRAGRSLAAARPTP